MYITTPDHSQPESRFERWGAKARAGARVNANGCLAHRI